MDKGAEPENNVRFSTRILIYFAVWMVAVLAFEIGLEPEGLTETTLTPLQQRLELLIYAPVMVLAGLAEAISASAPDEFAQLFFWFFAGVFLVHAIGVLFAPSRLFVYLIGLQLLALAAGVACFINFSRASQGG